MNSLLTVIDHYLSVIGFCLPFTASEAHIYFIVFVYVQYEWTIKNGPHIMVHWLMKYMKAGNCGWLMPWLGAFYAVILNFYTDKTWNTWFSPQVLTHYSEITQEPYTHIFPLSLHPSSLTVQQNTARKCTVTASSLCIFVLHQT